MERYVFVSSVSRGLEAYREALIKAIDELLGFKVVPMERFGMRALPPLETCLDAVTGSNVFLGIVGPRYGSRPPAPNDGFSYTEHEYNKASELGISCLMAILPDGFLAQPLDDAVDQQSLELFRKKVNQLETTISLPTQLAPNDLVVRFLNALANLDYKRAAPPAKVSIAAICYDLTGFGTVALSSLQLQEFHQEISRSLQLSRGKRAHFSGQGKFRRIVVETLQYKPEVVRLAKCARNIVGAFADRSCDVRFAAAFDEDVLRLEFDDAGTGSFVEYDSRAIDRALSRLVKLRRGMIAVHGDDSDDIRELQESGFHRSYQEENTIVWQYERPWSPDESYTVPVDQQIIKKLARPLLAGPKAEELNYHRTPKIYGAIRKKLLDPTLSLIVLIGPAGIGKSLCGLRLVAELGQHERRRPVVPRIAAGIWDTLNRTDPDKSVVFLDDAFGKSFVRRKAELDSAHEELRKFFQLDSDPNHRDDDAFGEKPLVVITVRPNIWSHVVAAWDDKQLAARLEPCVCVFPNEPYRPADYVGLFEGLYRFFPPSAGTAGGYIPTDFETLVGNFRHPMDVRDFFDELKKGRLFDNGGKRMKRPSNILDRYNGSPDKRYAHELDESGRDQFCYFFFLRAFGNGLLPRIQLIDLFCRMTGRATRDAYEHWQTFTNRSERWGSWSEIGHFTTSHPLREEALHTFFSHADARGRLDGIFSKLASLCDGAFDNDIAWQAAAFSAPQVGETLSSMQKTLIHRIATGQGDQAARVTLANAISFRLGAHYDQICRHHGHEEGLEQSDDRYLLSRDTSSTLVQVLRDLLASDACGAAAAAVCDSYRRVGDAVFGPPLVDKVCLLVTGELRTVLTSQESARECKSQVAWAITANFEHLPAQLHSLFFQLARDGDEWVRLRCGEAILDYYKSLRQSDRSDVEEFVKILAAAPSDSSAILRRGIAAALAEANLDTDDELDDEDRPTISNRLLSGLLLSLNSQNPTDLDTIEWVIWACGKHLQNMLRLEPHAIMNAFRSWTLHPNARVRKWAATALGEEFAALELSEGATPLAEFLARLAEDPNEHVCNEAAEAFIGGEAG